MIFFTYHLSFPSLVLTCPHEEIMSKCLAYYARILQSVKNNNMVLSLSLCVFFFKAENETPSSHRSGAHSAWMKYEVLPQHEQRVSDTSCQPAAHV